MKYIAAFILLLFQVAAFGDQVSDMYKRFDRAQYDYSNCFKDNLCGEERFSLKDSKGENDKERLFEAISSKCISPSVGFISATTLPLDSDSTYKINIESISRSTTLIMKCTPERSFSVSITENPESCSKASDNKLLKNISDVCGKALEPKTYGSVTHCKSKKGYKLNLTTQKCERICEKGKVLFPKLKPGVFIECKKFGGNSCSIYDQNARLLDEKTYDVHQYPASYFEVGCISCDDSNYFKDPNYTETKDDNFCYMPEENGGCQRGQEPISKIIACNGDAKLCPKNPEGTFRKSECQDTCGLSELRDENGKCQASQEKSCEIIKEQLNYIMNWDYRSLFRNARIQDCTSEDIQTALSLKVKTTIQDLQQKSLACSRGQMINPYSWLYKYLDLGKWLGDANKTCFNSDATSGDRAFESLYNMPPNHSEFIPSQDGRWYEGW